MHLDSGTLTDFVAVLFDDNSVPMVVWDVETLRYLAVNDAALMAFGYTREEFLARCVLASRDESEHSRFFAWFHARRGDEGFQDTDALPLRRADGSTIVVCVTRSRQFVYAGKRAYLSLFFDVSAGHVLVEQPALAYRDMQTGLPNRAAILRDGNVLPSAVAGVLLVHTKWVAAAEQRSRSVLGCAVNEVAVTIRALVPQGAVLARYADDVFAVVVPAAPRNRSLIALGRKLVEALARPLQAGEDQIVLSPSVGIAPASPKWAPVALFRQAECALDSAQHEDGRVVVYDDKVESAHQRRAVLERHLRDAIVKCRVSVAYQPIVDLATGRIVAAEALMRWNCPGIGPVPPVEFIAIAEDSDLILKLGTWILREACAQARRWARAGHAIRVAVNVSARQVEQRGFVRLVASTFEATSLDPRLLELELTEGTMTRHDGIARRNIERLRRMGVRIAIDDFGTGYSALSYLNTLPLDTLKIDRSFIAALSGDEFQADVTRSVIALAHGRSLTVVAEGVESVEQARRLAAMGCDEVQGFLYGVPSTALEVSAMLECERLGTLLGSQRVAMPADPRDVAKRAAQPFVRPVPPSRVACCREETTGWINGLSSSSRHTATMSTRGPGGRSAR